MRNHVNLWNTRDNQKILHGVRLAVAVQKKYMVRILVMVSWIVD
jgi:hypothetical protein